MENILKDKKKIIITVGIAAALILVLSAGAVVYSNSPNQRLKRHLNLGYKYLEELDYEQAVVAFQAALTIDPKDKEALTGISTTYTDWGSSYENTAYDHILEAYGQAASWAEQLYALFSGEEAVAKQLAGIYMLTGNVCELAGRIEQAEEAYEKILALAGEWEGLLAMQEEAHNRLERVVASIRQRELMKALYDAFVADNIDIARELMGKPEYGELCGTLASGESFYYGEYDGKGKRSGKGAAMYRLKSTMEDGSDSIPYYYYGD